MATYTGLDGCPCTPLVIVSGGLSQSGCVLNPGPCGIEETDLQLTSVNRMDFQIGALGSGVDVYGFDNAAIISYVAGAGLDAEDVFMETQQGGPSCTDPLDGGDWDVRGGAGNAPVATGVGGAGGRMFYVAGGGGLGADCVAAPGIGGIGGAYCISGGRGGGGGADSGCAGSGAAGAAGGTVTLSGGDGGDGGGTAGAGCGGLGAVGGSVNLVAGDGGGGGCLGCDDTGTGGDGGSIIMTLGTPGVAGCGGGCAGCWGSWIARVGSTCTFDAIEATRTCCAIEIGFFGRVPASQPTHVADVPTGGCAVTACNAAAINLILGQLAALGLQAFC